MKSRVLMALALLLMCTALPGFAQVQAPGPKDRLIYEFSDNAPRFATAGTTLEVLREVKANGQQFHRWNTAYFIFEPSSFTVSPAFTPDRVFDFKVNSTKADAGLDSGTKWKNKYTHPARAGSQIREDASADYSYVSKGEKTANVMIEGKETEIKTIVVAMDGYWTHGSLTGSTVATIVYSPALQAIVSYESVSRHQYGTFGSKYTLKEIKRDDK
jgi:hypothetical protein